LKVDGISALRIDGITCEDNTYTNSSYVVGGFYIYLCNNVALRRNTLTYTGAVSPNASGLSAVVVDSVVGAEILDNTLTYSRADQVGDLYNGISLTDAVDVATGYVCRGNTVQGFYGPSLGLGGNAGITIGHPTHDGTWASLIVDDNTITDTGGVGLRMFVSHWTTMRSLAGVTVTNNTISGSGHLDLVNDGHGLTLGAGNTYATSGHIDY
jgi:hypothetical protein